MTGVDPRIPDFMKLADAFGCPGIHTDSADAFDAALRRALKHKGPTVIMVRESDRWLTE